jgi:hypothetical protein
MAVNYAGQAAGSGLPVPDALFLTAPCEASVINFEFCVPMSADLAIPSEMKAVVLVYSDDFAVGSDAAKLLWTALEPIPLENRDFVTMTSDPHGFPSLIADHGTTYTMVDAADWYGIWKVSTALFNCTFAGTDCEYALGNTPEQTFMGEWSDGTPLTPLTVTDDPGPPPGAEEPAPEEAASPEAEATPVD